MSENVLRAPSQKWTDDFNLGRDQMSLEDTISPGFFALEIETIFRRTWLYVGRVERVGSPGSYFTREYEPLKTSLLVTRDKENNLRVFHNVCPHRGNKLVWDTYADRATSGRCSRFVCKFHGVAFGPSGNVELLTDEVAWLGDQGRDMHLAEVPFDVWNGFIFVNLTPDGPQQSLREFIGEDYWTGFDGYPFGEMTEWYSFRANADANWKALMDGFAEIYHAATTHKLPFAVPSPDKVPAAAGHFADLAVRGPHRYYLTPRFPDGMFNFPYEEATNALATGPRYEFPKECTNLPKMANPTGYKDWGNSTHMFWPNLYIQFYYPGWFTTYIMQPIAYNKMRFELDIYMPKPKNFSEMLAQKSSILQFMEAALQDFSLLEAQQLGLETRAFKTYPLTDQEVLLRAFHQRIQATVAPHQSERRQT